jgi:hypothetical protein
MAGPSVAFGRLADAVRRESLLPDRPVRGHQVDDDDRDALAEEGGAPGDEGTRPVPVCSGMPSSALRPRGHQPLPVMPNSRPTSSAARSTPL